MRLWCGLLAAALALIAGEACAEQERRSAWAKVEALWRGRWDVAESEALARIRELLIEDPGQQQRIEDIDAAVTKLQPWFSRSETAMEASRRGFYRRELVTAISRATRSNGIDHRIAVSMAMQETSLLPYYGYGGKNGSRGERGYFHVFPRGAAEKRCGQGCSQHDPACNAATAMCWLARCKTQCGADPWLYVAAYNVGACPPNAEAAQTIPYPKSVRSRLCTAYPDDCSSIWPE
jgi:hypothetical protein